MKIKLLIPDYFFNNRIFLKLLLILVKIFKYVTSKKLRSGSMACR